jgi:hypothetical protein
MDKKGMLKPAAIGGILLGVLSSLPIISFFNCFCCAWIIGGGILAAYIYVKDSPAAVKLGEGVALGLMTGIIGTAVVALFSIPLLILSQEGGLAEQILKTIDQVPGFPADDRKAMVDLLSREGFGTVLYVLSIAGWLVINCLMAMVGGTLGIALFEKRRTQGPAPGAPPAEPPSLPPPPTV